jgi:hypothetical protein
VSQTRHPGWSRPVPVPVPSPELRARVIESVRREPARTRAQSAPRRLAIAVIAFLPAIVLVALLAHHGDSRPPAYIVFVAGTWALLATMATRVALGAGRSMLGPPRAWLVGAALSLPLALAALAVAATGMWPQTNVVDSGAAADAVCIGLTTLAALGPVLAFAWLRRGSDPAHPRATGALVGAAGGACGATAVTLFCEHGYLTHVLVAHVLPIFLVTLFGALAGGRVIAVRSASRRA